MSRRIHRPRHRPGGRSAGFFIGVGVVGAACAVRWGLAAGLDVFVMALAASLLPILHRARMARSGTLQIAGMREMFAALLLVTAVSLLDFAGRFSWGSAAGDVEEGPLRLAQMVAVALGGLLLDRSVRGLLQRDHQQGRDSKTVDPNAEPRSDAPVRFQRCIAPEDDGRRERRRRLLNLLQEEIRIPLNSLRRVGTRLDDLDPAQLRSAAEALCEESERLDQLLEDAVEDHSEGGDLAAAGTEITAVLETLLSGHRSLLKALGVQVKVLLCHRREEVHMDRSALLMCLSLLITRAVERARPGTELLLRSRDVAGLLCLELEGEGGNGEAHAVPSLDVERATETLALHGGELWLDGHHGPGFGLTVPQKRIPQCAVPAAS